MSQVVPAASAGPPGAPLVLPGLLYLGFDSIMETDEYVVLRRRVN